MTTTGKPGAVHLAFPTEVMSGGYGGDPSQIYSEPDCIRYPAFPTRGDLDRISRLADLLAESDRPLFITGGGAAFQGREPDP